MLDEEASTYLTDENNNAYTFDFKGHIRVGYTLSPGGTYLMHWKYGMPPAYAVRMSGLWE